MPSKQGPRVWLRLTNLQHPQCNLPQLVAAHPINHAVQLIVPASGDQTSEAAGAAPCPTLQNDSCLVTGLLGDVVHDLVQYAQRQFQASSGSAPLLPVAVALGPKLDSTGGICVTDDGRLHLSVTASTYKQLGLVGRHSSVAEEQQYIIDIDLTSKGIQPGKPYHERVVSRLNQVIGNCCLAVAAPSDATQPSAAAQPSVSNQAETSMEMDVPVQQPQPVSPEFAVMLPSEADSMQALPQQQCTWMVDSFKMPDLSRSSILASLQPAGLLRREIGTVADQAADEALDAPLQPMDVQPTSVSLQSVRAGSMAGEFREAEQQAAQGQSQGGGQAARAGSSHNTALELLQWLGAVSCGCQGEVLQELLPPSLAKAQASAAGPTTSSMNAETMQGMGDCKLRVTEWQGLIHSTAVLRLAEHSAAQVTSGVCKWAAIGVWGWEDSPISWVGMEHAAGHACGLPGDTTSHYWLLVLPDQDVLVLRALGVADVAC